MKNYDRKVHKACVEMGEASSKELGKLGVPFFCIAPALVSERGDGRAEGKRRGTVSREELGVLRGRMVGLLEDLCGGEEDGEGVSE